MAAVIGIIGRCGLSIDLNSINKPSKSKFLFLLLLSIFSKKCNTKG